MEEGAAAGRLRAVVQATSRRFPVSIVLRVMGSGGARQPERQAVRRAGPEGLRTRWGAAVGKEGGVHCAAPNGQREFEFQRWASRGRRRSVLPLDTRK